MSVTTVCGLEIWSDVSCGCWPSDIQMSIHCEMGCTKTTRYLMFLMIIFLTVTIAIEKSPLLKKLAVIRLYR